LPGASLAYYGLARTFVQPGTRYVHAAGKAAMLQRVALRVAPQNVLAANELGVLMAEHGHLNEAESLFKRCVATDATPEAWQNLAVVYSRKGNTVASQAAMAECSQLVAKQKAAESAAENAASDAMKIEGPIPATTAATTPTNTVTDREANRLDDGRKSLWSKFQLSQRIPNIFHR
jgi:predicted Zn-dependent protease